MSDRDSAFEWTWDGESERIILDYIKRHQDVMQSLRDNQEFMDCLRRAESESVH